MQGRSAGGLAELSAELHADASQPVWARQKSHRAAASASPGDQYHEPHGPVLLGVLQASILYIILQHLHPGVP